LEAEAGGQVQGQPELPGEILSQKQRKSIWNKSENSARNGGAFRRQRQEDSELKTILGHISRPVSKEPRSSNETQW
jgi:hypothetical protein